MAGPEPLWNNSIRGFGGNFPHSRPAAGLFQHFFPAWEVALLGIVNEQCQPYYQEYKENAEPGTNGVYKVVECILNQFPQFRQLEMNISSIILGLTPTFLQAVGVGSVQLSLLHLHRPLLALALSLGSPAILPMHSDSYESTIKDILEKTLSQPDSTPQYRGLSLDMVTLVFAIGAAGNSWYLAYQLGYWSISMFAVGAAWLPIFWQALALLLHFGGLLSLRLTLCISHPPCISPDPNATCTTSQPKGRLGPARVASTLHSIGNMKGARRHKPPVNLKFRDNTSNMRQAMVKLLNWVLYVCITVHTAFGSVLLASLIFISVADSFSILFRYLASTLVCRMVLSFELSRMEVKVISP
jgi:hypothetical protein